MRALLSLVGALVTVAVSVPAAQTPAPPKPVPPQAPRPADVKTPQLPTLQADNPKNPYRDLFEPQKDLFVVTIRTSASTVILSDESPRVACGMRVIPVDPNVDPGIVKVPDLQTRHAIRAIKPPCLPD